MPDIALSVQIERTSLSLGPLEVNDQVNYRVAAMLGGQVSWQRTSASSTWMDGDVTVNRRRGNVNEQFTLEVLADNTADLHAKVGAAFDAFNQNSYTITVTIAGTAHVYLCESADYGVKWDGPREIALQAQVALTVPRQPVPVSGPY